MIRLLSHLFIKKNGLERFAQRNASSNVIYALASGFNQKCGVAVVRMSGKGSLAILSRLTNKSEHTFEPRKMYLKSIWHPISGKKIDKSMVVWFKGWNIIK